jgi:predicted Zn-dependent protease
MCEHHETIDAPRLVDLSTLRRRDLLHALSLGLIAAAAPGCATNPETGRSQLLLVDEGQLVQMSLSAWDEQKKKTPVSRAPALVGRLERVGLNIARASGKGNQPWEFVVFDTPEKNAFVLPGNKVGFYRGLMELADKDDHVACVLGHEVGHVTGRHAAERYSQNTAAQLGLGVGAAVAGGSMQSEQSRQLAVAALGLGVQVGLLLPFSRAQESEADRLGIDYMYRAGYDVRESLVFWRRMGASGGDRPPQFLSTHPDPASRMEALRGYINAKGYAQV